MDPRVQGRLQGTEEQLFTPTSPSTHSLLVLPFSLLSDGYQSPGKCKSREANTELIFASFLKGGRCRDPLCQQHSFKKPKIKILISSPPPVLFTAISCAPCSPRRPVVLQNLFKKQNS